MSIGRVKRVIHYNTSKDRKKSKREPGSTPLSMAVRHDFPSGFPVYWTEMLVVVGK